MAALTTPEGCYLQPTSTDSLNQDGLTDFSYEFKGTYSALKTWMNSFNLGTDTYDGKIVRSRNLRRVAGDLGVLTIHCGTDDTTTGSGDNTVQNAFKGVWSCRAMRLDKSILSYCGSANERSHIEMWLKETDSVIADSDKYKDDNGTEHSLTQNEKDIVNKIRKGCDTVVRFYPVLTYKSYYKKMPENWGVGIGFIRTPEAAAADKIIAPKNLNSVIQGFVWLKMQDDVEEQPDGTFTRIQSWWGIHENDGGWDTDLYGDDRWPMPKKSGSGKK